MAETYATPLFKWNIATTNWLLKIQQLQLFLGNGKNKMVSIENSEIYEF